MQVEHLDKMLLLEQAASVAVAVVAQQSLETLIVPRQQADQAVKV